MPSKMSPRTAILVGGLLAGAIDIGAACLITGKDFVYICQTIAGGLLGRSTFDGGCRTTLLGFALQEVMALLIAAIFYAISQWLPRLTRNWIAAGLGYGAIVFFVMNYAVVPLSAWHRVPHFGVKSFTENMIAMLVFGLILAFFRAAPRSA